MHLALLIAGARNRLQPVFSSPRKINFDKGMQMFCLKSLLAKPTLDQIRAKMRLHHQEQALLCQRSIRAYECEVASASAELRYHEGCVNAFAPVRLSNFPDAAA